MPSLEQIYPPFALSITCGPLAIRAIRDEDIPPLIDLALDGIHAPDEMPFSFPWTQAPRDQLPFNTAAHYWSGRAEMTPERWRLTCVVRHDDEVVGCQDLFTQFDYRKVRSVETGSWLGLRFHGRGIGTLMRQTMCAFAFDHLGAEEITSAAFVDNPASNAVSRKVGYRDQGATRQPRGEGWAGLNHFTLAPADLVRPPYPVDVSGAAELRRFLGLDAEAATS